MAAPRPDPLAFFLTWTTYGTWLPGDGRGWTDSDGVVRESNLRLAHSSATLVRSPPVVFDDHERAAVAHAIGDHCRARDWSLHALACRTTHVHAVISATGHAPAAVMGQLKAWASRRLAALPAGQRAKRTWTRGGSARWLWDEQALAQTVTYVAECQDGPRFGR